jgi:hypothetical protein
LLPEDTRKAATSEHIDAQKPTVESALHKIKSGLDNLALELEVKSLKISQEVIEPLDCLNKDYYGEV